MKKRNFGFSLVELLCVLVILALLAIIIGKAVVKSVSDAKTEISESQEKAIINAAEKWSVDNSNLFDDIEGTTISVGLDILYIVDVSGSMRKTLVGSSWNQKIGDTRYYNTVAAINASMEALESPNNAIMITTFGANNKTALPLASYSSSNGEYLYVVDSPDTYSTGTVYNTSAAMTSTSLKRVTLDASGNVTESSVSQVTINFNERYTRTQKGIYYGVQQLMASRSQEDAKTRIPVVIFITDGYPDSSGSYTESDCSVCTSSGKSATGLSDPFYYALMAGYESRKMLEDYYSNSTVFFYTIGFGIDEVASAKMILDPGSYSQLSQWNYVTKAYQQEGMTAEDLRTAFSQISNEVIEAARITQVCVTVEDLYNGGYLTTKDVTLADGQAASEYVIMSINDATNQYGFNLAKTEEQKRQCEELLAQQSS